MCSKNSVKLRAIRTAWKPNDLASHNQKRRFFECPAISTKNIVKNGAVPLVFIPCHPPTGDKYETKNSDKNLGSANDPLAAPCPLRLSYFKFLQRRSSGYPAPPDADEAAARRRRDCICRAICRAHFSDAERGQKNQQLIAIRAWRGMSCFVKGCFEYLYRGGMRVLVRVRVMTG